MIPKGESSCPDVLKELQLRFSDLPKGFKCPSKTHKVSIQVHAVSLKTLLPVCTSTWICTGFSKSDFSSRDSEFIHRNEPQLPAVFERPLGLSIRQPSRY